MIETDFMKLYEELSSLNGEPTILTEGTKYDKKAISKLAASGLFNEEISANIVNALFREDIHAFVHAPAWLEKYLIGIVNMLIKHCNGDVSKAEQFLTEAPGTFEEYLTWVKEVRPKLPVGKQAELDKEFNEEMSYEDLVAKLNKLRAEREAESSEKLKSMTFKGKSNYELIPIDSFEQFNKLFGGMATGDGSSNKYAGGGGTAWCHANHASTYDTWVSAGKNKFFVLANKDWKNIHFSAESNAANPKDAYGNSLIAILVNTKIGSLQRATLRCNHMGVEGDVDNQYQTYAELSNIAGFNVEDRVKEYLQDSLVDLTDVNNIFDGSRESLELYCDLIGTTPSELRTIVIPDSVKSIGSGAFSGCDSLTSVTIGNGVKSIGYKAFYNCTSLMSVQFSTSVKSIGSSAFELCTSLTNIVIPDKVTSIGNHAFNECTSLMSITIPDSVENIGSFAFARCTKLTSVTIGNSVKSIGDWAFYDCNNLTITTNPGSYAEQFAKNDNISVKHI